MGSCSSVICSVSRVEKVGKFDKVKRRDESEGTSEVEIHMNCPSNSGSWESELMDLKEDSGSASVVSSSTEVLGFEADDEMSSDTVTSSFPSREESENGKDEARNPQCTEGEPGPSKLRDTPNNLLPPSRSSKWKQVYSKKLEQKEQLAEEKRKKRPRRRPRTKKIHSQEDETHANKIRIIKKIKNAIKAAAARDPDSGHAALPTDETIAQIFGVAVEDCRDSSSDECSISSSSASTRPSSETSWNSPINSDEDLEQQRTGRHVREVQTASTSVKNKPKKSVKTSKSKGANTTPYANSWDSSTTVDEEFREPNVGRPHIENKSTTEIEGNGQASATTSSPSTNSWDRSTTLDEEFEEPKVACSWHSLRMFKSISDSEKNEKMGPTGSPHFTNSRDSSHNEEEPTSEATSSRHSSTTLDKDFQKPSTPKSEMNVQCGARARSCSTSSWNTSTNSLEDLDQLTMESENNGQKARKARKWFRFKTNKVAPLQ